MTQQCTTDDCGNHTATWLCGQCVTDLQAWIDKALLLIPDLDVTIARLDVTRPGNPETRNANHAGSAAPANLDALQLKLNMESIDPDAKVYALDPHAAGLAWLIQDWYLKAELLISGPDEPPINHVANRERAKEARGEPLPPREAIDYLRKKTKLQIKMFDFKNWVKHGKLTYVFDRVTSHDKPRKIYYPGDVFTVAQEMRDKRAKV